MRCPKCQTDNPDTLKFCGECGTQLIPTEEVSAPTETLEAAKEELTTGTIFAGRYQIIEELGKGGMGKVYKAQDTDLKEKVAIKLLKPEIAADKKTIERFRNELKFARKIRHKNVCQMYDLNKSEGAHYITMEYVDGKNLKSMIRMMGQLGSGKTISIAKQVCDGLTEAHRLGVVHRDLKPQNIMVDEEGNARIMDFGIARSLKTKGITATGVMIGTPEYMSPEQVEGKEVDQRSDIYSLGVILYEMVTGRVPFEGDTPFTIGVKHKSEQPKDPKEFNTQLPEDLNLVILRCLEKDKEKRYQSAGEVRTELVRIEKGIPTTERVVPKRKPIASKEITVTFGLRKLLVPALIFIAIVIIGIVIWQLFPEKEVAPSAPVKPSIAVLPFQDLSPEKNQEYLCDGLAESIINALTNIKDLRVPARTSSFSFKEKGRDVREIGKRLDVKTILEGSVQKSGTKLRVTAQLINVSDESLLWSDQFNREMEDVFAIQDEITQAIVGKLRVNLFGEERANLVKRHTIDPQAYEAYLKGRYYWNKRTAEGMTDSIEYFKQAIETDPNYALAYSGIADSYCLLGWYDVLPPKEVYPKARAAAEKALQIDDALAEALASLAWVKMNYDWNWVAAEKAFKKALELNPGYATGHQWYSAFLAAMGKHAESIAEVERAQELDPLSLMISTAVGSTLYWARQYDLAINQYQKTLEMEPNFTVAHWFISNACAQKGMYNEAISEAQKALNLSSERDPLFVSTLGFIYALSGKKDKAIDLLDELFELSSQRYVSSHNIAIIYGALGQKDQAFEWLEKAYEERDHWMYLLKVLPQLDNLRSDPSFRALLKKMNFE